MPHHELMFYQEKPHRPVSPPRPRGPFPVRLPALMALIMLLVLTAACEKKPESKLPRYEKIGGKFTLAGQNSQPVSLSDFKGKALLIFFGFTNCPDICPTTMLTLKRVHTQLGERAGQLQVVFITLDPERDGPKQMAEYVAHFDKSFVGLTGSLEQIREVAKRFSVFFKKNDAGSAAGYLISHTDVIYLIDQEGTTRGLYQAKDPVEKMLGDVKSLLE